MKELNELIENIKESEGFRGMPYDDTLGFATIGYGTKLPLSKEESEAILKMRMDDKIIELSREYPQIAKMPKKVVEVLIEMSYQLGVSGLLKFKKTLQYLENGDYENASIEMLNSRWAKQTPNRAKKLSDNIKEVSLLIL